jgi:hypothetical protein
MLCAPWPPSGLTAAIVLILAMGFGVSTAPRAWMPWSRCEPGLNSFRNEYAVRASADHREPRAVPRLGRGWSVAANFFRARSSSSSVNARSMICAVSPAGMACRSRSCASRNFSHVLALAVNRI